MAKHVWTTEKLTAADLNDTVDYLEDLAGGALSGQFAQDADSTAALVFGYKGGNFRNDNTITAIDDGTVTLTDDTTNYVEVAAAGVTANTTGFTSGRNPLFVITTADGAITTVVDKRTVAFMSNAPGDMLKSTYDTDNDGIVDAAESAPWSGITDKPSSFTPSTHASTHGDGGSDEIAIDTSQITTGTMAVARLPVMGGASSIAAGTGGIVPAPAAGDDTKFLNGAGEYVSPPGLDGTVVSINGETGVIVLDSSYVGLDNVTNDAQLKAADLDTDSTFAADSDSKIPSQKAVKTALDGKVSSSATQTANRIFSGPSSGSAAAPTFRALVVADLPTAIDAAKIADGSVSSTEFQYLNGVTSNIQDQIDGISTGGGATAIDDLSDVTITTPTTNQVLTYNGSAWVNDDATGGAWGSITGTLSDQTDLQAALDGKAAALGTDDNYVTDAEKIIIGNTSGTNTGDQTDISGNAATATKLATARNINGVAFDGTTDITISASGASDSIEASEALAAGDVVNVYNSSGEKVRKANATDNTKPATGFVTAAVSSGANATVYFAGSIITGLTGLTPGATQYLDTTGGGTTETAPSTAGQIVQILGTALSSTSMIFNPGVPFLL